MKKKHADYSLYRKQVGTRYYWYVRYWDPQQKRYTKHRSTGVEVAGKKGRRSEAEKEAIRMFSTICFNGSQITMLEYLTAFWKMDSPYFKESEMIRGQKLSAYYSKAHLDVIRLHIAPYPAFQTIGLGELTPAMIRDWMLWCAERGASGSRINRAIQAMRIPLRYALLREEVLRDPFVLVRRAYETRTEKGVLNREEARALISSPVKNKFHRLAVLLGALCGMRLGEVRGLHWDDLDPEEGLIHIRHNWQNMEGIKGPKCDSFRDVPLPEMVYDLAVECRENSPGPLIFGRADGKPHSSGYFRLALINELVAAGINKLIAKGDGREVVDDSEQRRRNITFHSLRHTFVTLNRSVGISDFEIQALAGHKSSAMMEKYSHAKQVIDYDSARRRIDLLSGKNQRQDQELTEQG